LSILSKKRLVFGFVSLMGVSSISAWADTGTPAIDSSAVNSPAVSATSSASSQQINPTVLKLALNAYNCATKAGVDKQKQLITIIDYSLPSSAKRMWVYNVAQGRVIYNTLVAHGQGSGDVYAKRFSNRGQTHSTSLGLFLTGGVYQGRNGYSLRLVGLEKGYNDSALSRSIVMHGAAYVNETLAKGGRIGRSWGCPAVPKPLAAPIINTIKGGSLLFAYYPDQKWLQNSKYLNCSVNLPQTQAA